LPLRYGTAAQEKILLADSSRIFLGEDPATRILIFGLPSSRGFVRLVRHIYIDGTFSMVPIFRHQNQTIARRVLPETLEEALLPDDLDEEEEPMESPDRAKFSQLYVVLAERDWNGTKFVFPILHALLPRKDGDTYTKLWRMIKMVFPELHPDSFSADFEKPAVKAVLEAFPGRIRFLGCAFHFRYSLDKQAQRQKLTRLFRTETCAYVKVGCWVHMGICYVEHMKLECIEASSVLTRIRPRRASGGLHARRGRSHHGASVTGLREILRQDLGRQLSVEETADIPT
jgi:hypothetical protein